MSNSDSTKNSEYRPGALVGYTSSAFLETTAELLIKSHVQGRHLPKRKENLWYKMFEFFITDFTETFIVSFSDRY